MTDERFAVRRMRGLFQEYWVCDAHGIAAPSKFVYPGPARKYAGLRNCGLSHEAARLALTTS